MASPSSSSKAVVACLGLGGRRLLRGRSHRAVTSTRTPRWCAPPCSARPPQHQDFSGCGRPFSTTTTTTTTTSVEQEGDSQHSHPPFSAEAAAARSLEAPSDETNDNEQEEPLAAAIAQGSYAQQQQQQQQQQKPPVLVPGQESSRGRRQRYNIYDMDARTLGRLKLSLDDYQDLVEQVQAMPVLEQADVGPLLLPLSGKTSTKVFGRQGAILTETLLFQCLAHLPADLAERYHPDAMERRTDPQDGSAAAVIVSKLPYPPASFFNRAMIAWGNVGGSKDATESAERAEALFQLQLQEYRRERDYLRGLQQKAFAADGDNSNDNNSNLDVMLPMEPFAQPPDRRCFKSRIRAWANCSKVGREGGGDAAQRADDYLREMERRSGVPQLLERCKTKKEHRPYSYKKHKQQEHDFAVDPPDLATYNLVMGAYARTHAERHPVALNRVRELAARVDDLHRAANLRIAGAAENGDDDDDDNMINKSEEHEYQLDGHSYIAILQTYQRWIAARRGTSLDPAYTHEVLQVIQRVHRQIAVNEQAQEQLQLQQQQNEDIDDDGDGEYRSRRNRDLNWEKEMSATPDRNFLYPLSMNFAYGVLVEALVKTQPIAETLPLADDILIALSGKRNRINDGSGSAPISIPKEICEACFPTNGVVLQLAAALERSGIPDADKRFQRLLHICVVERTYDRTFEFNEAMYEWSDTGWKVAPYLVESMLIRALGRANRVRNKPTAESFAIAMKTWLRASIHDSDQSPHRIEMLFQHMLHLYENCKDSWYKPHEKHVRYLLQGWLNQCATGKRYDGISGSNLFPAEHCELLIHLFKSKQWYDESMHGKYAMAIRAWAEQQLPKPNDDGCDDNGKEIPNPLRRAVEMLDAMAESLPPGGKLPAYPCNWVLDFCGRTQPNEERRREAYNTAIATLARAKHNARTFVLAAKVLREQVRTLDDEHLAAIEDLFKKACTCGMLSQDLITQVVEVARPETLQKMFGISYQFAELLVADRKKPESERQFSIQIPNSLLLSNLPQEWSVNSDTQRKLAPRGGNTKRF